VLTFRRELLQGYVAEEGTKVIVFSQFVSYLDLCGIYLRRLGVKFADYRGSMKQDAREAVIKEFTSAIVDDESPRVLLISLKCGGVGLNLTSASKVSNSGSLASCRANANDAVQVISLDLAWNAATGETSSPVRFRHVSSLTRAQKTKPSTARIVSARPARSRSSVSSFATLSSSASWLCSGRRRRSATARWARVPAVDSVV
jgi:hypothetical protein